MANFIGTARSNYFRVKDRAAFAAWAESLDLDVLEQDDRVGIAPSRDSDDGCWPSYFLGSSDEDDRDVDIALEVSQHLAEDEVAILMQIGAEKLRYLEGYAIAVNARGERVQVSLNDIYEKAREAFGVTPTEATY